MTATHDFLIFMLTHNDTLLVARGAIDPGQGPQLAIDEPRTPSPEPTTPCATGVQTSAPIQETAYADPGGVVPYRAPQCLASLEVARPPTFWPSWPMAPAIGAPYRTHHCIIDCLLCGGLYKTHLVFSLGLGPCGLWLSLATGVPYRARHFPSFT